MSRRHFFGQSSGVYTMDLPTKPLIPYNYTGTPPNNTNVGNGKVTVLPFNTSVELVMQDTSILGAEIHQLHLHGFNFFVVGQGFGNYKPNKDPVERNTVGVPSDGWVAICFPTDNPASRRRSRGPTRYSLETFVVAGGLRHKVQFYNHKPVGANVNGWKNIVYG